MGYNWSMFAAMRDLNLAHGGRVMDLGAQDNYISHAGEIVEINKFIAQQSGRLLDEKMPLPKNLEAREIFERAGYKHFQCDVEKRPKTIYIDLSKLVFPSEHRSTMDLVANLGTTEHLANPVGGFALMHYLTKPGGIMFHDVPLFGMGNHGLTNPTPKFWHLLAELNGYEVIEATI